MNSPRTIHDTGYGLVTDVSIKRKVRDYVAMASEFEIFIDSDVPLNEKIETPARTHLPSLTDEKKGGWYPKLQAELGRMYFDIRMFGAVLMTGDYNAGKVTGPMQLNFAMSLDPVTVKFNAGSQKGRRTAGDFQEGETEFGITTPIIPYGVYRTHGFFNPFFADQTGVSADDLKLFWEAMVQAFAFFALPVPTRDQRSWAIGF